MIGRFSASEQGLGYLYPPRFALLQMLQLPEEVSGLVEKDDDLEFMDVGGRLNGCYQNSRWTRSEGTRTGPRSRL